ncbi:AraC family transcriptional regulator ligand-binding domain-containing protein, partial [Morganella morganii]
MLDDAGIPEDLRIFLLERDAGGVLRIQRDLTGQCLPILRAGFRRPPPADPAPYVRELGLCPAFGQADNRVVFERRFLDLPLPGANPEVARACGEQCRALLARRQVRGGLAGRIRDRLLRTPGHL